MKTSIRILSSFFAVLFLSSTSCEKIESQLPEAKPYTIVGSHDIALNIEKRTAKMWFITSEANTFEEFAQTSILAAYEIHKENKKIDLVEVLLLPGEEFVASGLYYTQANYASDKKGALGLSGVDLSAVTFSKWFIRAADKPMTEKELTISKLWVTNQRNFPSTDMLSSLGYDREALTQFIADTLQIDIAEVELPAIHRLDYTELDFVE